MVDKAKDRIDDTFEGGRQRGTDAAERGRDMVTDPMPGERDFQGTRKDDSGTMTDAKDAAEDIADRITGR